MSEAAATGPIRTTLIDIANCIGCRACQVACKQWNEKDGEETEFDDALGFQNPATLSAKTLTLIAFHEAENAAKPEAWNRRSSCSGACTASSQHGSRRARRRRSTGNPTARCRTTWTSASAADTASWRVPGTCRRR